MTTGVPSSTTATQLLVVPRSIPMTFSAIDPLYSALVRIRTRAPSGPQPGLKSTEFRCDVTVPWIQLDGALQGPKGLRKSTLLPENLAENSMRGGILWIQ